ncbi:hypothetical protein GLOIN_2v1740523 [Rhizophagus irregularis DAOM 181602=DAOM 197198]|nr:hypothetical protein GLOIN_2v1740523 [Rhizophagus irregularis DAOM 181602=DAOM 197198]
MLCVALYFLIQVFQLLLKLYDLLFAFQLIAFFVLQFKLGPRNIHKRVRSEFAYNESKKSCRSFLLWIIPAKIIFPNLDNG